MYEKLLWNSLGLGVMTSHFGTFANTLERLLNLTNVEETFCQEVWLPDVFILGDFETIDCAAMMNFMHQYSYRHSHTHRLSKE